MGVSIPHATAPRRVPPLGVAGLEPTREVHWNATPAALYEHAVRCGEALIADGGALCVTTAPHTGRSPNDKFIVREPGSAERIWWGPVNQPLDPERFERLRADVLTHLSGRELFVLDAFAGADPAARQALRIVTPNAWHALFSANMFRRPSAADLAAFVPAWQVLHAPDFQANPAVHATRSGTVIAIHFGQKTVIVGGTRYAGELKKALFTVMNYLLPSQRVLPMHCSATLGAAGDVALFFGLSGTGKTTLSADPERSLIGDDEHGWSDRGVFNVEGGCYAKVIRLSSDGEPAIYATTRMFGTVLENVVVDPETRVVDFAAAELTENTRASYPIHFITPHVASGMAGHPVHLVLLTCDAFGVMPPIARLTPAQTMYHFLSGYTAKVAGTERGVAAPKETFSACFGAPFLPLPPHVYAELLGTRIAQHGAHCWLVNTGWTGGPVGTGGRVPLAYTRAMVRAALGGELDRVETLAEPVFGLDVPLHVPGVPDDVLLPRATWADAAAYDAQAARLARLFGANFTQYEERVHPSVREAGPRA